MNKKKKLKLGAAKTVAVLSYGITGVNFLVAGCLVFNTGAYAIHAYLLAAIMLIMTPITILDRRNGMYNRVSALLHILLIVTMSLFLCLLTSSWWVWVCLCEGAIVSIVWWIKSKTGNDSVSSH